MEWWSLPRAVLEADILLRHAHGELEAYGRLARQIEWEKGRCLRSEPFTFLSLPKEGLFGCARTGCETDMDDCI